AVVARRLLFLERAMVRGFEWTPAELRRRYVDHPLLRHVARGLVWEQDGRRFRIGEDGAFSDSADEPLSLHPEAPVRLAHPGRMPEDEVIAWSQLLSDYEIVQPIQQMGRATRALPEAQRSERTFTVTIPPGVTADEI